MFMKFMALSLIGFVPVVQASALIKKDDQMKTLTVTARMVYSGEARTQENVEASTNEIKRLWNETPTDVTISGESYRVIFNVDYEIPTNKRKLKKLMKKDSCAYNFIQILSPSYSGDRSYYEGLGSRFGVFYTSDELGISTTAAHEFGHGLMLEHNDSDQLEAEVPGIMFARGTIVKPQFQWAPSAKPGEFGGTLKPHYRRVRSQDIQDIPFTSINFVDGLGCIGDGDAEEIPDLLNTEVENSENAKPEIETEQTEEVENEEY